MTAIVRNGRSAVPETRASCRALPPMRGAYGRAMATHTAARVLFHGREGAGDAVDRGPDDLVAEAIDRVMPGGPGGQHLPGLTDSQLCHASPATHSQHVLQ